jgi:hypothetical protein
MTEREPLDRHVLTFPMGGPPVWVVIRSEEYLAEERLTREVQAMKENRSEKRAHVEPPPVCRQPGRALDWNLGYKDKAVRRSLKERQAELFGPADTVDERGKRVDC